MHAGVTGGVNENDRTTTLRIARARPSEPYDNGVDAADRIPARGRSNARLRIFQDPGRADLSEEAAGPRALLRMPFGRQQRVQAGEARARQQSLERGAIAQELRNRITSGGAGGPRQKPAAAATACARVGR